MNPMHLGLELLATAQNQSMLQMNTSASRVHGFASRDELSGAVSIFLINKFEVAQKLRVSLPVGALAPDSVVSMVDTTDHWGKLTAVQPVSCVSGTCQLTTPPVSFTVLRHQGQATRGTR